MVGKLLNNLIENPNYNFAHDVNFSNYKSCHKILPQTSSPAIFSHGLINYYLQSIRISLSQIFVWNELRVKKKGKTNSFCWSRPYMRIWFPEWRPSNAITRLTVDYNCRNQPNICSCTEHRHFSNNLWDTCLHVDISRKLRIVCQLFE